MAKKGLSPVPQNGTQPAITPTPMDNMFSGDQSIGQKKANIKKPTSFNLDPEIFKQFKKDCVDSGKGMSSVIEDFMIQYHDNIVNQEK